MSLHQAQASCRVKTKRVMMWACGSFPRQQLASEEDTFESRRMADYPYSAHRFELLL